MEINIIMPNIEVDWEIFQIMLKNAVQKEMKEQ